jgi:hypothetical protein
LELAARYANIAAERARCRRTGRGHDDARVTLFQTLAAELQRDPLQVPPADPHADSYLQASIETYFSNSIEGTEFELEEAHDLVVQGSPLQYREDDSHDILGTYQAILKSRADPVIPQNFEAFATQVQEWNRQVIESRRANARARVTFQSLGRYELDGKGFCSPETVPSAPEVAKLSFDDSLLVQKADQ